MTSITTILRRALAMLGRIAMLWLSARFRAPHLLPLGRRHLMAEQSRRTLRALGVGLRPFGAPPPRNEPLLIVANHVSWIDVHVLSAGRGARFVAKAETRHWPVVGPITEAFDALFIVRGSFRDAARTKDAVAAALRAGERVVVFPEATTTDGTTLGYFHPAMFQAAIDAGARILPVALRYRDREGRPSRAAPFIDDLSFAGSLARVLVEPVLRAEVHFGAPIAPAGRTRRELAADAREAIAQALGLPLAALDRAARLRAMPRLPARPAVGAGSRRLVLPALPA